MECWVDILEPAEALTFPADDIGLPPPKKFEVRVIIWSAKDVVSMDTITKMNGSHLPSLSPCSNHVILLTRFDG